MTSGAKNWGAWLVLALFLALLYFLGTIRFHQEGRPWALFLIILPLAIILVLLSFRGLEPKDS